MRIAINATFLGSRAEGIGTYARSVIQELASSGEEVFIYSPDRSVVNGRESVRWRKTPQALSSAGGRFAKFRAAVWCPVALPAYVLRDRAQVLFCPSPEGMLTPVCPQVLVVHDLIPLFDPGTSRLRREYFARMLPQLLKASRGIVADSEHTKQDLTRTFRVPPEKITVVYPWIDRSFFTEEPGARPMDFEEHPYFLFVGRASAHKNLEMVIRAFAAVRHDVAHRLVCVVGFTGERDRNHYQEILALAASLGVQERLGVYTGIPREQLLYLYRHAEALVLLSKYEGFGYPPLEAMAVGTPAIVSNSTSLAEVAGPAAICVPNDRPEPTVEAMKRLAWDAAFRTALSEKGKGHARTFSRERSVGLIRAVIESCVAGDRKGKKLVRIGSPKL